MKKYLSVLMLVSAIVLSACSTNDSFDSILAKSNQSEIGKIMLLVQVLVVLFL